MNERDHAKLWVPASVRAPDPTHICRICHAEFSSRTERNAHVAYCVRENHDRLVANSPRAKLPVIYESWDTEYDNAVKTRYRIKADGGWEIAKNPGTIRVSRNLSAEKKSDAEEKADG